MAIQSFSIKKIFFVTIFFILHSKNFAQTSTVHKHALIFAIGNYPEAGGWPKISSLHDVPYIQHVLSKQGFLPDNIKIISDENATLKGIENAFEELIKKVNKGDIALIHFSSHGERVEADNDNKIDGLDECVVTYNAVSPFQSKDFQKDQAEYLRGHMLGSYLKRLRAKLGNTGDVIVFMDNCYSGDGTRGASKIRGGEFPFVSSNFNEKRHKKSDSSFLYKETVFSNEEENELASYEVISATRPEEVDHETRDETTNTQVGSLTYAISKAFENLQSGSKLPTYRALFANIQAIMNVKVPSQHPLLEGNGSERIIFGGAFMHQMPYIEISKIDKENQQIIINQGEMAGLGVGAKIAIFPSGTLDTSKVVALARGTIIKSGNFLSTATLDKSLMINTAAEGWVFISEYIYNIEPVTINFFSGKPGIQGTFSSKEISLIKKYVSNLSFIKIDDNPEILIDKGKNADSLKINGNGYLFSTVRSISKDSLIFKEKLEAYTRYKFLQKLHSEVKNVNVEIQLVPIVNGKPDTTQIRNKMMNNNFIVHDGDTLTLKIKNTGMKDAYVNILDLQPDGTINPILPNSNLYYPIYAHDLKIPSGQEFFLPAGDFIFVSPPYGTEVFKIFASEKEINVENIATNRGYSPNGMMTKIESLVNNSYRLSRGIPPATSASADATTSEFIFQIKPKKAK